MTFLSETACPFYQVWYLVFGTVSHSEASTYFLQMGIFFCVHVYSTPVQLHKDMWADRSFHLVAARNYTISLEFVCCLMVSECFLCALSGKKCDS